MRYDKKISDSLEDYLEAIYLTSLVQKNAKSKAIMERLKVSGSSVTEAMHTLKSMKLVDYQPYGSISLTPNGKALARDVVHRHEVIRQFLIDVLVIEEEIADKSACLMEHAVTPIIIERMICYARYLKSRCKKCGAAHFNNFRQYISD